MWNKTLGNVAVHGLLGDLYTVGVADFFYCGVGAISH